MNTAIVSTQLKQLLQCKNIWIYGAGKKGKTLLENFHFLNIPINGVVISKKDGTKILNTKVMELSEVSTPADDTLFIITASEKHHREIITTLNNFGFNKFIIWDKEYLCELWKIADYKFVDRRTKREKCCFILAGYKEFLWDIVFTRFQNFIPKDIDVCIISSGADNEKLSRIATNNSWSYLTTKINSVTLVQNIAFAIFKDYKLVYKIDEDIFITKNSLEKLYHGFMHSNEYANFVPGIVVPLIPVNGYGYHMILSRLNLIKEYEKKFGRVLVGGNPDREIENNPEAAIFMWTKCPQIDEMNISFETIYADKPHVNLCAVRFNIGFILMEHSLWGDMQGFNVSGNVDMGVDEEALCAECINRSKAITVCNNTVVGHFAFGRQTNRMKEIYNNNRQWFDIN